MSKLTITITRAGLERFTAAQLDEDLDLGISSVALTDAEFVVAPTLEELPGEFRRLSTISGDQVGDNIVHMTIRDDDPVGYTARGFGLFLADGTLFAVYGQDELLFEKSPLSTFMAAIDIAFPTGDVSELVFGNTDFLNPPATTERKGVVELATIDEGRAGADPHRVTPVAVVRDMLDRQIGIGAVMMWWGTPQDVWPGWAICDGREVDRSDGTGRIVLPDFTDRSPFGAGGTRNLGDRFGSASKTVNSTAAGEHSHSGSAAGHSHDFQAVAGTNTPGNNMAIQAEITNETAGGGTGRVVRNFTATIDGPTTASAPTPLTIQPAGQHQHQVTVDVISPSLALYFIMKV